MSNKSTNLLPLEFIVSNLCYGLVSFLIFGAFFPYYLMMILMLLTDGFSSIAGNGLTLAEAWLALGPLVLFMGFISGSATMVYALTAIEERSISSNFKTALMLAGFTTGTISIVMLYRYVNRLIETILMWIPADFLVYGDLFCVMIFTILLLLPTLANLHIFLKYLRVSPQYSRQQSTTRLQNISLSKINTRFTAS